MAPKPAYQKLNSEDNDDVAASVEIPIDIPIESPECSSSSDDAPQNEDAPLLPPEDAPPPYEPSEEQRNIPTPATDDLLSQSPPLYTDIVKLPTYNESQNIESDSEERVGFNRMYYYFVSGNDHDQQDLTDDNIGSDIGFILCFLMSFIFNGLGFIVAYCSSSTLCAHYGAISGFGLSLVKWAFIVKHKGMLKEYFEGNDWLLYCIILLGWMIFLRGMFAYAQLKKYVYSRRRLATQDQSILE